MNRIQRTSVVRGWLWVMLASLLMTAGLVGGAAPVALQAETDPDAEPATIEQTTEPDEADTEAATNANGNDVGNGEPDTDAAPVGNGSAPATVQSRRVAMPSGSTAAVVRIEGMIYGFTLESLERRVDRAMAQGVDVVVIEIHTKGGTLDAGMAISRYIKNLPVYTVAWINDEAYSAGILIASAANEIVMAPASATGDSAPVVMGQDLAPTERAKALSPILEEFRDNARANGYDYALFQAMTVLGVEAYLVEHRETGERRVVNQVDKAVMVDDADPAELDRQRSALSIEERLGQATIDIARDPVHRGQWREIRHVHDGNTLLTMNQTRAQEVGLAQDIIANEQELQNYLGAASLTRISPTWSEQLAGFLTNPVVRGVLVIALLLGAYIEFQTPGVGVAGGVALLAVVLLLGAPFVVGLAEVWHVLVFLVGLALLIAELLWMPGFGFLGIGGVVLMFIALILAAVPTGGGGGWGPVNLPPPEMWGEVLRSSMFMMLGIFASFIGFYFITKHFGRIPGLNRLVLEDVSPAWNIGEGRSLPMPGVSGDEAYGEGRIHVGDTGRVTVELRPTGRAEINGEAIDVVSYGRWIEPGSPVKVVEVHGNRIVVDSVDA